MQLYHATNDVVALRFMKLNDEELNTWLKTSHDNYSIPTMWSTETNNKFSWENWYGKRSTDKRKWVIKNLKGEYVITSRTVKHILLVCGPKWSNFCILDQIPTSVSRGGGTDLYPDTLFANDKSKYMVPRRGIEINRTMPREEAGPWWEDSNSLEHCDADRLTASG